MGEYEKALISVCIPMYNSEKTIVRCVKSVSNQTYENIEIILLDDGSNDRTGELCKNLLKNDKRIKYIRFSNAGLASARNRLVVAATGDYITFVDSDDFIKETYVSTLYDTLKVSEADISIINHKVCSDEMVMISDNFERNVIINLDSKEAIRRLLVDKEIQNYVWGKLYKRKVFKDIVFPEGHNYEDMACMYKIFLNAQKIAYCEKTEYMYIINTCGIVSKTNHKDYVDEISFAYERFLYLQKIDGIENENAYGFIIWFLRVYKYMKMNNDYDTQFLKDKWEDVLKIINDYGPYIYEQLSNEKQKILNTLLEKNI